MAPIMKLYYIFEVLLEHPASPVFREIGYSRLDRQFPDPASLSANQKGAAYGDLICEVIAALLHRLNIPHQEIAELTDQIVEKGVPMFFDSFEAYDVQQVRREAREQVIKEMQGEIEDAKQQAILASIRICKDFGIPSEKILAQLILQYQLSEKDARKYLEQES